MTRRLLSSAATFAKNVTKHAQRVVAGQETPSEAWAGLTKDARKLKHALKETTLSPGQKESADLLSEGRHAYNDKDYVKAEAFFRQALVADAANCSAQTYLGHALYKQGRATEAAMAWQRAINIAPTWEAAEKARQKLLHLQKKKDTTVEHLEERLRGGQ